MKDRGAPSGRNRTQLAGFPPLSEKVEPLVYKIALNLAASRLRRRKIWRWLPLDALRQATTGEVGADEELTRDQERARVREAVLALPEDLRRVVILSEFTGMTYAEIAEALSIPTGTVGSRRHRALKLLRDQLSGEAGTDDEGQIHQTL